MAQNIVYDPNNKQKPWCIVFNGKVSERFSTKQEADEANHRINFHSKVATDYFNKLFGVTDNSPKKEEP